MFSSQSAAATPISSAQAAQAVVHCNKGIELFYKKEYQAALQEVDAAIGLNPNYADAHCLRGSCYRETGRLQDALVAYEYSISLLGLDNPKTAWFYYNRSVAYSMLNEYQKALNDANKFLEFSPGNTSGIARRDEAKSHLTVVAHSQFDADYAKGNYAAALSVIKQCIADGLANHHSYYKLGHAYALLGNFTEANQSYLQSLEIASSAEKYYVHYQQGMGLSNLGKPLLAIEAYKRVIHFNATYMHAYKRLEELYSNLGDHDQALFYSQAKPGDVPVEAEAKIDKVKVFGKKSIDSSHLSAADKDEDAEWDLIDHDNEWELVDSQSLATEETKPSVSSAKGCGIFHRQAAVDEGATESKLDAATKDSEILRVKLT